MYRSLCMRPCRVVSRAGGEGARSIGGVAGKNDTFQKRHIYTFLPGSNKLRDQLILRREPMFDEQLSAT
jgi:hypothetical protein